jgi:Anaphase-promoting complex, cyclosome, subunit 3
MENIDLFDKYTGKELNAAEVQDFEKSISENEALKSEFELYTISKELIKQDNLRKEVNKIHRNFTKKREFTFPTIRIAALILFGLIGYSAIWINTNDGTDLLKNKTISYIEPVQRGETAKKNNTDSLYSVAAFEQLIDLYKIEKNPDEKFTFLTAMAYFQTKNYKESLEILQKMNAKESAFKNEIPFYTGQCLVGLNKITDAIKTFESLGVSNPYARQYDWKYKLKLYALKLKF